VRVVVFPHCSLFVNAGVGIRRDPVASPRGRRGLRTAHDRDVCVQRPLHHEVVSTGDAQRGAYGAVAPFDFANDLRGVTNHRRLDVRVLVGKIDQDDVAELKPLNVDLNRHRVRV
jgi:hypothetical protein